MTNLRAALAMLVGLLLWGMALVLLVGCATVIRPYSDAELRLLCAPAEELFEMTKWGERL